MSLVLAGCVLLSFPLCFVFWKAKLCRLLWSAGVCLSLFFFPLHEQKVLNGMSCSALLLSLFLLTLQIYLKAWGNTIGHCCICCILLRKTFPSCGRLFQKVSKAALARSGRARTQDGSAAAVNKSSFSLAFPASWSQVSLLLPESIDNISNSDQRFYAERDYNYIAPVPIAAHKLQSSFHFPSFFASVDFWHQPSHYSLHFPDLGLRRGIISVRTGYSSDLIRDG